jgi:hypothetical protein
LAHKIIPVQILLPHLQPQDRHLRGCNTSVSNRCISGNPQDGEASAAVPDTGDSCVLKQIVKSAVLENIMLQIFTSGLMC